MLLFVIRDSLIAIAAGGLIGMERQWRRKLAGVRTTALVSLGACMFVMLSHFVSDDSSPNRVAAQVVSGIGFLAGGVIIKEGLAVKGINTAATLWCSAAVGTIIGTGYYIEGTICAFIITLVNTVLRNLSYKIDLLKESEEEGISYSYLSVVFPEENKSEVKEELFKVVKKTNMELLRVRFSPKENQMMTMVLSFENAYLETESLQRCIKILALHPAVMEVELLNI